MHLPLLTRTQALRMGSPMSMKTAWAGVLLTTAVALVGCGDDDGSTNGPGGPTTLSLSSSSIAVLPGRSDSVAISGGTAPYAVATPPDTMYATAIIRSASVVVTGIAPGSTSLTIRDAAGQSVTLPIAVPTPQLSPGTLTANVTCAGQACGMSGTLVLQALRCADSTVIRSAQLSTQTLTMGTALSLSVDSSRPERCARGSTWT